MLNDFQSSACTKMILFGEHVVLYGLPAIAIPLKNQRLKVKLTLGSSENTSSMSVEMMPWELMKADLNTVLEHLPSLKGKEIGVDVKSKMPPGVGGGVSAAWSVALVRAAFGLAEADLSNDKLIEIVEALENSHHGKASGIDHMTIINENATKLENGKFSEVEVGELDYVLVNTGPPRESTKEMVEHVATIMNDGLLEKFKAVDFSQIGEYGQLLEELETVPAELKQEFDKLRTQGFEFKVCGAGGKTGGAGLVLTGHTEKARVYEWAESKQFETFEL